MIRWKKVLMMDIGIVDSHNFFLQNNAGNY